MEAAIVVAVIMSPARIGFVASLPWPGHAGRNGGRPALRRFNRGLRRLCLRVGIVLFVSSSFAPFNAVKAGPGDLS